MKKTKGMSIGVLLVLLLAVPMLAISVISIITGAKSIRNALLESNQSAVESMSKTVMESFENMYAGDWSYVDGVLYKGENNVSGTTQDMLDDIKAAENYDITLFWGDTRVLTTLKDKNGDRIVGTKADEKVSAQVLGGQPYFNQKLVVNGVACYVGYEPMNNPNGDIVGMVFVGYPRSAGDKQINNTIRSMVIVCVVVLAVFLAVAIVLVRIIIAAIMHLTGKVNELGEGDLNVHVQIHGLNKSNELGLLADDINGLVDRLKTIISGIQENSDVLKEKSGNLAEVVETTELSISQVTSAIEEVAMGSTSQAQDTASAMASIEELNATLDTIIENVIDLANKADSTTKSSLEAKDTMTELIDINTKTKNNIDNIVQQSDKNVEAVNQINSIVKTIEEITSQTNLLSLNASIEAARAGEAGRGFAVVAQEIGSLANSSAEASRAIQDIISSLVDDIQETSRISGILNDSAVEQIEKLESTEKMFTQVISDVQRIYDETKEIRTEVENIGAVKDSIGDTIEGLSSISEENAAASQQTTASASLVTEDMKRLGEISREVKDLSENLKELVSFFK